MVLPFDVRARLVSEAGLVQFVAVRDEKTTAVARYHVGNIEGRRKAAKEWVGNKLLENGSPLAATDIEAALEAAELSVFETLAARDAELDEPDREGEATKWNTEERNSDWLAGMRFGKSQRAERGPSRRISWSR